MLIIIICNALYCVNSECTCDAVYTVINEMVSRWYFSFLSANQVTNYNYDPCAKDAIARARMEEPIFFINIIFILLEFSIFEDFRILKNSRKSVQF